MSYVPNGFKVSFVIPKKSNAGSPFDACLWAQFGHELRGLQPGFTEIAGGGEWQGQHDPESVVYVISVRTEKEVDELRELLRRWRIPLEQEAMYFDCQLVYFELISE